MSFVKAIGILLIVALIQAGGTLSSRAAGTDPSVSDSARLLLVHYMPWFESPPVSKKWGWHWTMNHYDPSQIRDGRSEIASHYRPFIGPYDSSDPDLVECHALLMKFAGIDGAVIDWYGCDDYNDYGQNHRNTLLFIDALKRAGLRYTVMYEDQTVPRLIEGNRVAAADRIAHGQKVMAWMCDHWFSDPAFLRVKARPAFMVFGSGYYSGDDWVRIFAGFDPLPALFTESLVRGPAAGAFDWPQPGKGTDAGLAETIRFDGENEAGTYRIPTAFPRFHDIYKEAGNQPSWGEIDDRDGQTYRETLSAALRAGTDFVQIATWNDWGEGTQIEPSIEFGFRDLEATLESSRAFLHSNLPFSAADLRLPIALYRLRKHPEEAGEEKTKLDSIANLLFAGKTLEARKELGKTGVLDRLKMPDDVNR